MKPAAVPPRATPPPAKTPAPAPATATATAYPVKAPSKAAPKDANKELPKAVDNKADATGAMEATTGADPATVPAAAVPDAATTGKAIGVAADAPTKPGVAGGGKAEIARVWMSVGEHAGLEAEDLIASIVSETGLGREVIRKVEMRDRFSIVEVPKPLAEVIMAKMKRVPLMGRRLKVKLA